MKFLWFGVVFLTFCLACEMVLGDYSESMLPSKEIRNRVHRTMRVNMRVGKRFGDDEEAPKRRLRLRFRTGKRTFNDAESPETDYTETLYDPEISNTDTLNDESIEGPKRRLKLVLRQGKRTFGNLEQAQLYGEPNLNENFQDNHLTAPKRRLRMVMRTGKRTAHENDTPQSSSLIPQIQFNTEPTPDDLFLEPKREADYKRSAPLFLLNPRVGKNDKTWKISSLENLHKRSDPKAADLWFGPRIGRSNDEQFEDNPWSYIILNENKPANLQPFKSNEVEQPNEEPTE